MLSIHGEYAKPEVIKKVNAKSHSLKIFILIHLLDSQLAQKVQLKKGLLNGRKVK